MKEPSPTTFHPLYSSSRPRHSSPTPPQNRPPLSMPILPVNENDIFVWKISYIIDNSTEETNLSDQGHNYSEIFEVTMVQLRDCSQNLKTSRSTEPKLFTPASCGQRNQMSFSGL